MKSFLLSSYRLIPSQKKKKLPGFFAYSLFNTLLDLISIVYLAPLMLLFFDKPQLEKLANSYLNLKLTDELLYLLLASLLIFYLLKNILQAKIIGWQSKFIYGIATQISQRLVAGFMAESYQNEVQSDKNAFFRDVFQLPVTFATNVLFPVYQLFSEVFILAVVVLISLVYYPIITIISVVVLSVIAYLLLNLQKRKVSAFNENIVRLYQENVTQILNIVQGFVEIKTTRSAEKFRKRFETVNKQSNDELARLLAFKQTNLKYFELLFIAGLSLGILFLMLRQSAHDLVFISFLAGASIRVIPSFNKILSAILDIKANKRAVSVLSGYTQNHDKTKLSVAFKNRLQLQKVSFDYGSKPILEAIELAVEPGDFIAISGPSGEGKSTLLYLMAGLLAPKSGSIVMDGLTMDSSLFDQFENVVYAPQQPFLFQGSLRENLTMLQENVDENRLEQILSSLDLSDWIAQLPQGLDTPLLLESKTLSGGQKQRIALARVLYFNPKLLLLDETTNQLNEALEEKVWQYLKKLTLENQLAIVAVSHSKKATPFADRSYVLENGKLHENG